MLGQGERIIVNGAAVQMATPSKRHIEAFAEKRRHHRAAGTRAADTYDDADDTSTGAAATRAA